MIHRIVGKQFLHPQNCAKYINIQQDCVTQSI